MSTDASTADSTPERPVALDSEADLDEFLAAHDRVLVDFYTEGCTLCASIEPVVGNVARAHDDLAVATINPRNDPPLIDDNGSMKTRTRLAKGLSNPDGRWQYIKDRSEW